MNDYTNGYHQPPPPQSAPRKCVKAPQRYLCHHTEDRFIYCGGPHPNDPISNRACHETRTIPPGETLTGGPGIPSYCSLVCQANGTGWYCCQCTMVYNQNTSRYEKQAVTGRWVGTQVVHWAVNGQEHIYCGNCSFIRMFLIFLAETCQA